MINNRQNGRRRGRNGNGQRPGNPGSPGGGSRIDNRARGNANQLYEKYKNLARDAQMSGDRVNTEYYLQFADHYFRVLSESRPRMEDGSQRRIPPVDSFDDPDGDEDYGDEGEPIRSGDQGQAAGREQRRDGYAGNGARRDGGQGNGQRDEGRRDERRPFTAERLPTDRDEDQREGVRGRDDDRFALTGSPVANDPGEDSPDGAEPTPVAVPRRGRPRREPLAAAPAEPANDVPVAIEADRLPPSLAGASGDADAEPRPRRRRGRPAGGDATQAG